MCVIQAALKKTDFQKFVKLCDFMFIINVKEIKAKLKKFYFTIRVLLDKDVNTR
jgi:hypothetical protein